MISVDAYLLTIGGGLLAFGIVVLLLGMRQPRDDESEPHVPAE